MKALVLIGGLGTRLRPVTLTVPKQLIPLAGKPMLYHVLDLVPPDVEEVVLATGYRAEQIDAYVRAHPLRWPVRTIAEAEPLGTGGGMRNAADGISDPFYLLNSDVIAAVDLAAVARRQAETDGLGTMTLAEVDDTRPYGVVALGENDRITGFVEKPAPEAAPSHWINAGLAVWRREVLDLIPHGRPVSFEQEVVPHLLDRGLFAYRLSGYWDDAGTPERLLRSQRLLFDDGRGGPGTLPADTHGEAPVALMEGASARGAFLGPYVTLAPGARVEADARVRDSVLMEGAVVEKGATVEGCLLGPRALVRAGHRTSHQVLGEGGEA